MAPRNSEKLTQTGIQIGNVKTNKRPNNAPAMPVLLGDECRYLPILHTSQYPIQRIEIDFI